MRFQIEVRSRSPVDRRLIVWFNVEAVTERGAIEEAMRRFTEQNPAKRISDYKFEVVWEI